MFFYKYEKTYEKQIRDSKADKILSYQALVRRCKFGFIDCGLVNEVKNTDLRMGCLRPKCQS